MNFSALCGPRTTLQSLPYRPNVRSNVHTSAPIKAELEAAKCLRLLSEKPGQHTGCLTPPSSPQGPIAVRIHDKRQSTTLPSIKEWYSDSKDKALASAKFFGRADHAYSTPPPSQDCSPPPYNDVSGNGPPAYHYSVAGRSSPAYSASSTRYSLYPEKGMPTQLVASPASFLCSMTCFGSTSSLSLSSSPGPCRVSHAGVSKPKKSKVTKKARSMSPPKMQNLAEEVAKQAAAEMRDCTNDNDTVDDTVTLSDGKVLKLKHCNKPYCTNIWDFFTFCHVDLKMGWSDIEALHRKLFPILCAHHMRSEKDWVIESRRKVSGLNGKFYRSNDATPATDDDGIKLLFKRKENDEWRRTHGVVEHGWEEYTRKEKVHDKRYPAKTLVERYPERVLACWELYCAFIPGFMQQAYRQRAQYIASIRAEQRRQHGCPQWTEDNDDDRVRHTEGGLHTSQNNRFTKAKKRKVALRK